MPIRYNATRALFGLLSSLQGLGEKEKAENSIILPLPSASG